MVGALSLVFIVCIFTCVVCKNVKIIYFLAVDGAGDGGFCAVDDGVSVGVCATASVAGDIPSM